MKKAKSSIFLLVLLLLSAAALARKKARAPEELGAELRRAPARAAAWKNPYTGSTDALLAGQKLYRQHCAECHGADGRGQGKAPDLRVAVIQGAPPGVLFWFLKNGNVREGMPSWSRLPDQQRWQLVTYLESFK